MSEIASELPLLVIAELVGAPGEDRAKLARLEIHCLFDELLRRLPDIDVAGPVRRLPSTVVNSIKSPPVRFTPSTA